MTEEYVHVQSEGESSCDEQTDFQMSEEEAKLLFEKKMDEAMKAKKEDVKTIQDIIGMLVASSRWFQTCGQPDSYEANELNKVFGQVATACDNIVHCANVALKLMERNDDGVLVVPENQAPLSVMKFLLKLTAQIHDWIAKYWETQETLLIKKLRHI